MVITIAILTQTESAVVLACLVFVVILLVVGGILMWNRLTELEDVVYAGDKVTQKAKKVVNEIRDISDYEEKT